MKLPVKRALEMYAAIQQLDNYSDGGAQPKLYSYDGTTRLRLAIARRRLREVHDDYMEARNQLLLQVTNGTGELPAIKSAVNGVDKSALVAQHIQFDQEEKKLLNASIELPLQPIPAASFKLDENPIPTVVLDLLGDLIGGMSDGADL